MIYDCVFAGSRSYLYSLRFIYWDLQPCRHVPGLLLPSRRFYHEIIAHIFKTHEFVAIITGTPTALTRTDHPEASLRTGLQVLAKILTSVRHLRLVVYLGDYSNNTSCILLLKYFQDCIGAAKQPLESLQIKFVERPSWYRGTLSDRSWSSPTERSRSSDHAEVVLAARYICCEHPPTFQFCSGLEKYCLSACNQLQSFYYEESPGPITKPLEHMRIPHLVNEHILIQHAIACFYSQLLFSTSAASVATRSKKGLLGLRLATRKSKPHQHHTRKKKGHAHALALAQRFKRLMSLA